MQWSRPWEDWPWLPHSAVDGRRPWGGEGGSSTPRAGSQCDCLNQRRPVSHPSSSQAQQAGMSQGQPIWGCHYLRWIFQVTPCILQILLEHIKEDESLLVRIISADDKLGNSPLHLAAEKGYLPIAQVSQMLKTLICIKIQMEFICSCCLSTMQTLRTSMKMKNLQFTLHPSWEEQGKLSKLHSPLTEMSTLTSLLYLTTQELCKNCWRVRTSPSWTPLRRMVTLHSIWLPAMATRRW